MTTDTPPPGSDEAVRLGCLCPVMDNHYGRGYVQIAGESSYVFNENCPLHGLAISIETAEPVPSEEP